MADESVIDAGGIKVLHRETGEGPAILMLHGFPQTGHCWRAVGERLSSRFRVLMPDVPGFGGSDAPPRPEADSVAEVMCDYLDVLGIENAVVVGHDWGGAFSFRLALDHPERVTRLVVTNTAFREISPLHSWYIFLFNVPVLPELGFRAIGDRILSFALRGGAAPANREVFDGEPLRVYQDAYSDPERVRSALAYYRTVTRQAFTKQFRARLRRGVLSTDAIKGTGPKRIDMPVLIVWGMKDPALPPKLLRGMKRDIPQAEIVELPEIGHFVPEEAPDDLAAAIERFVP